MINSALTVSLIIKIYDKSDFSRISTLMIAIYINY